LGLLQAGQLYFCPWEGDGAKILAAFSTHLTNKKEIAEPLWDFF